jgi:retron-type reverse transcriptase
MPTWAANVVHEVRRSILAADDAPQVSPHSHGCKPNRGGQTARTAIPDGWVGTQGWIEGDRKGGCDNLEQTLLRSLLRANIRDQRFLRLIARALQARYCAAWPSPPSLSGSPQGGIVSPRLSTIDMARVARFVEETLIPEYTPGRQRAGNPAYARKANQGSDYRKTGNRARAEKIRRELPPLPSVTPRDAGYSR